MPGIDGGLDVKCVELGDEFSLLVPMNWTCGYEEGRWWCSDRDGIFTCYFRHEIAPASNPPAHPLDHAQRCLDIMRRWLEQQGTIGVIDERQTLSGGIVHGITDDAEDSGVVYRHARWGVATGFSEGTLFFRVTLAARVEHWDDLIVPRLIEHFAAQVAAGIGTQSLIAENLGLRDLRIDGPVVVSVPAAWSARQVKDGVLAQGPDGVPRLVASVSHADDEAVLRAISEAGPARSFSEMAELGFRAATALARTLALVVNSIDRAEYGAIIAGEVDAPGAADQQLVWYYVIPLETRCLVAGFELAIPLALRDRPDMVDAKSMMAREIARLRLEFDHDNDDDD